MAVLPHIVEATARRDQTIHVRWSDGSDNVFDFTGVAELGGTCVPLRDLDFFERNLQVDEGGYSIRWSEDIDFCAESLWYRAHLEDYWRDYPAWKGRWPEPDDPIKAV